MIIDLSKIKSGFSDKLRAVTYCIALNKLSNKKHNTFFIYETKTKECPFKFIDLCKVKNIKIVKLKNKEKSNIKLNSYNTEITLENCIKNNPLKYVDNQELFFKKCVLSSIFRSYQIWILDKQLSLLSLKVLTWCDKM